MTEKTPYPEAVPASGGDDQDAWLDEALAESFPASDPLPWVRGDRAPLSMEDDVT